MVHALQTVGKAFEVERPLALKRKTQSASAVDHSNVNIVVGGAVMLQSRHQRI